MLTIKDISKKYKNRSILEQINIRFPANSICALVGSNGVGKSTLLKIICGLLRQDNGTIEFRNQNISNLSISARLKLGLGYLSQENTLIQDLSVEDNIYVLPRKRDDDESLREELILEFALAKLRKQKCKRLSGGEARKVEFCRCMASRPLYVLLDEPFSGLDPKTTHAVLEMIKRQHKKGMSFVITDHRMEEIKSVAHKYFFLHNSKIAFTGDSKTFFHHPLVREHFLGTAHV